MASGRVYGVRPGTVLPGRTPSGAYWRFCRRARPARASTTPASTNASPTAAINMIGPPVFGRSIPPPDPGAIVGLGDAVGRADPDADADGPAEPDGDALGEPDGDALCEVDGDGLCEVDGEALGEVDGEVDGDGLGEVGGVPGTGSGSTLSRVGTTGLMVPSALNSILSIVVSRCVPSPPGMANRW